MPRSPSAKKKGATRRAGSGNYREAMAALDGMAADNHEIGQLNKNGTVSIDPEKLEELKRKLGEAAWSRVRFVALNAPFKRRLPVPSP